MSDWIELNQINSDYSVTPASVRAYCVCMVEKTGENSCKVLLDDDKHDVYYTVAESYKDVLTKIKEAEGPIPVPVAEYFTIEEYGLILDACKRLDGYEKIEKKLKEIIKEEE